MALQFLYCPTCRTSRPHDQRGAPCPTVGCDGIIALVPSFDTYRQPSAAWGYGVLVVALLAAGVVAFTLLYAAARFSALLAQH